jgi:hypothetical protein
MSKLKNEEMHDFMHESFEEMHELTRKNIEEMQIVCYT